MTPAVIRTMYKTTNTIQRIRLTQNTLRTLFALRLACSTSPALIALFMVTKAPIEKKPQPTGLKGHIVNVVEDCILCGICEKASAWLADYDLTGIA